MMKNFNKKINFSVFFFQIAFLNKQGSLGVCFCYDYIPKSEHFNGNFELYMLVGFLKFQISFGLEKLLKNTGYNAKI